MNTGAWKVLVLTAVLLAGCSPAPQDDSAASALVNPYPPGEASPMFFRSAANWEPYAPVHSAKADARHGD